MKLGVSLKASFESVQLELKDGRMSGLKLGNPTGNISLKCASQEVAAFKRDLKINQAYTFATPVPMAVAAPAAEATLAEAGSVVPLKRRAI
ncbi:hypothetical protein [Variovorax sp. HW608]|uniref:hypothetical protein n=1 Tax=Variovorax sp. HW608 TaxID=1034889 RepID=UPI0015609BA7|nr:hypothetical protein [Variovorax sp. HW608]